MMISRVAKSVRETSLTLKIGSWFEASATGWGVVALSVVVLLILATTVVK